MQRAIVLLLAIFIVGCKKNDVETPSTQISSTTIEAPQTSFAATTQHMPSVLPNRVAFGVENDPSHSEQFIQEADYRYQYLAGDIFSNGWTTWNSPSGEFARTFLNQTREMGKIPVFTYYNIVPAHNLFQEPATINLNDAETMKKYLDDWKFLLQICKQYGGTVIIHYEPDLFGYLEMYKNDPTKNTVKVSQSNHPDAMGFSNDAKGLAQLIVSMRNKYAPNVLLGWHASQWAAGHGLVQGSSIPEQLASETASYYQSLQAPFDLLFSEFSDRDNGYDALVRGNLNTLWSTIANVGNGNLSDFDRFQIYLKRLNLQTGLKIMLWQIPIGNTLTKTCNNSLGHYQDNRPEYFLQPVLQSNNVDKINKYGQAGVIAFLFGWGINGCTTYMDFQNDGVTAANETADDDGGFLRKGIKAYYKHGAISVQ